MRQYVCVVVGALILCVPTILNGAPFLFWDTVAYLNRPEAAVRLLLGEAGLSLDTIFDSPKATHISEFVRSGTGDEAGAIVAGRSIYYGMLVFASYHFGRLWPLVAVHGLLTAWVVGVLYFRVLAWRSAWGFLALMAGLAALTPLGFFTGLVMPDALAPVLILSAAILLAAGPAVPGFERALLAAVAGFAMLAHSSHLLVGGLLLALAVAARAALPGLRGRLAPQGIALLAGAVGLAVAGAALFGVAVARVTGHAPITSPHLTAHLVDGGPGTAFLKETCPGSGFALCELRDHLPMSWVSFLFLEDPATGHGFAAADPGTKRAISAEQGRFVAAVFMHDPLASGATLWRIACSTEPRRPGSSPAPRRMHARDARRRRTAPRRAARRRSR